MIEAGIPAGLTTVTIFHFPPRTRIWSFVAMAPAGYRLGKVEGLRFRKMMGAGSGLGFSARPDFGRYALLATWRSQADAERFLAESRFMDLYRRRAEAITTWTLRPERSHGTWDGANPFAIPSPTSSRGGFEPEEPEETREIGVLTRATIRLRRLPRFWRMVAPVSRELEQASGLESSIGIGEVPWLRQATFSVWRSEEEMKAFAYGSEKHRDVVRRTREEGWYSEDLFARFTILACHEWRRSEKK